MQIPVQMAQKMCQIVRLASLITLGHMNVTSLHMHVIKWPPKIMSSVYIILYSHTINALYPHRMNYISIANIYIHIKKSYNQRHT